MVACCKLLGVRSFVLNVSHGQEQQCSYKSPSNKSSSLLLGRACRAAFHSPEVSPWLERRQRSVGSALSTRSPYPAQLSSLEEPGAQDPAGPQAPPIQRGQVLQTVSQEDGHHH